VKLFESKQFGIEDCVLADSTDVGLHPESGMSVWNITINNSAPYCLFFGKMERLFKPNIQLLEETSDVHTTVIERRCALSSYTSDNAVLGTKH